MVTQVDYAVASNPFGNTSNDTALNTVFGAQNVTKQGYDSSIFSAGYKFIFIDGSDSNSSFPSFISNNKNLIQNYVSQGGRLFINAAPNYRGSPIDLGFGVTETNPIYSSTASALVPSNYIFNGKFGTTGSIFTGNEFAHAVLNDAGANVLIRSSSGDIFSYEKYGSGVVAFGTMTTANFHSPQPQATQLLENIFDYVGNVLSTTSAPPAPAPPSLSVLGTHATADTGEASVNPFSGVSVSDTGSNVKDAVQIGLAGGGGTLSGAGLIVGADGSYSLAAADAGTISGELQGLTFTPTNGTPGAKAETDFTLVVSSSGGYTAYDTSTRVVDTAVPTATATPTDGADYLVSGPGPSLISALQGNDSVVGQAGNDTLYGGKGADTVLGNQGADLLYGNQGDDVLYGGQGNDTLYGGKGNDLLFGGKGDDVLSGDQGNDTFAFNPGDTDFKSGVSTGDTIADFTTGTDKIDFTTGPIGTAMNFGSASTAAKDFASAQAVAQALINGGDTYAFVANGTDGYLFTTGGSGTAITDAVKLAGAGTTASLSYTDIAHHPVV